MGRSPVIERDSDNSRTSVRTWDHWLAISLPSCCHLAAGLSQDPTSLPLSVLVSVVHGLHGHGLSSGLPRCCSLLLSTRAPMHSPRAPMHSPRASNTTTWHDLAEPPQECPTPPPAMTSTRTWMPNPAYTTRRYSYADTMSGNPYMLLPRSTACLKHHVVLLSLNP